MSDISIHCPKCNTSYEVTSDLIGNTFECGSCEHQFIVAEPSNKKEKFYPGEKKGIDLDSIPNDPKSQTESTPFKPIEYADNQGQTIDKLNATPLHFIAIGVAIIAFITGVIVIYTGHKPQGVIFHLTNYKRMYLALFISGITFIGFTYGMKKSWKTGAIIGASLGAILCSMVVAYKDTYPLERAIQYGSVQPKETPEEKPQQQQQRAPIQPTISDEEHFKQNIHYSKFVTALSQNEADTITGFILYYPSDDSNLLQNKYRSHDSFRDLFNQTLGKDSSIEITPSNTPIQQHLTSLAIVKHRADQKEKTKELISLLTNKLEFNKELKLYTINLSPLLILPENISAANSPTITVRFNEAARELLNINKQRQEAALQIIKNAKQLVHAPAIFTNLTRLVNTRDIEFQVNVISTLTHWRSLFAQPKYNSLNLNDYIERADQAVLKHTNFTLKQGLEIPLEATTYLTKFKVPNSESLVLKAWQQRPVSIEPNLIKSKLFAQQVFKGKLATLSTNELTAALTVLSKVGNKDILDELNTLTKSNNSKKIQDSLRSTIDAIQKRL